MLQIVPSLRVQHPPGSGCRGIRLRPVHLARGHGWWGDVGRQNTLGGQIDLTPALVRPPEALRVGSLLDVVTVIETCRHIQGVSLSAGSELPTTTDEMGDIEDFRTRVSQ